MDKVFINQVKEAGSIDGGVWDQEMVKDSGQILKTGPIGFFEELYVKHERKRGFKGGSKIFGPKTRCSH